MCHKTSLLSGHMTHAADRRRAGRFGVLFTRLINQCTIFSMEPEENKTEAGRAVGYARVSTTEQDLQLQVDALHTAGVTPARLFVDKASGAKTDRPGLGKCLEFLQAGDLLLVWRLDRLGRSMVHLVGLVEELQQRGVGFRSICDGAIDTTTASGELVFNIFLGPRTVRAALDPGTDKGRTGSRPSAGTPRRPAAARLLRIPASRWPRRCMRRAHMRLGQSARPWGSRARRSTAIWLFHIPRSRPVRTKEIEDAGRR